MSATRAADSGTWAALCSGVLVSALNNLCCCTRSHLSKSQRHGFYLEPYEEQETAIDFEPLPNLTDLLNGHIEDNDTSWIAKWNINDNPNLQYPRSQLKYVKQLGSGWFGPVIQGEAIENGISMPIAVRLLHSDAGPILRKAFLQEAEWLKESNHPNVLRLWGACLSSKGGSSLLLLLPFYPEGDLKSYLRKRHPPQVSFVLNAAVQITSGLEHLHRNGFIHPDLAARNCLVGPDFSVVIGEYGYNVELYQEDYLVANSVAVPLRWCSPESLFIEAGGTIQTQQIHPKGNIWSLGVLLWEIGMGAEKPYSSTSDSEVLQRVIKGMGQPLKLETLPQNYPKKLTHVIDMCCNHNTEQRPNAPEVNEILSQLLLQWHHEEQNRTFERRWQQLQPRRDSKEDGLVIGNMLTGFANGNLKQLHSEEIIIPKLDSGIDIKLGVMPNGIPERKITEKQGIKSKLDKNKEIQRKEENLIKIESRLDTTVQKIDAKLTEETESVCEVNNRENDCREETKLECKAENLQETKKENGSTGNNQEVIEGKEKNQVVFGSEDFQKLNENISEGKDNVEESKQELKSKDNQQEIDHKVEKQESKTKLEISEEFQNEENKQVEREVENIQEFRNEEKNKLEIRRNMEEMKQKTESQEQKYENKRDNETIDREEKKNKREEQEDKNLIEETSIHLNDVEENFVIESDMLFDSTNEVVFDLKTQSQVRGLSRSLQDLMVLTHIDLSDLSMSDGDPSLGAPPLSLSEDVEIGASDELSLPPFASLTSCLGSGTNEPRDNIYLPDNERSGGPHSMTWEWPWSVQNENIDEDLQEEVAQEEFLWRPSCNYVDFPLAAILEEDEDTDDTIESAKVQPTPFSDWALQTSDDEDQQHPNVFTCSQFFPGREAITRNKQMQY